MSSTRLRIKRGLSDKNAVEKEESTRVSRPRPGPLSKKSKVTKIEECEGTERTTRVQRFIREMKDTSVREGYIETVDKHVDKLLESVRDRRSESCGRGKRGSNFSSRKPSQAIQIAETTKRIDLTSADSILGHVKNPRVLLNPTSFASLPLFYQYKLVKMLPTCDQLIGKSGWVKPSAFSLTNEFFTKACSEWCESLKEGKFNPDIITRKRMEIEKEKTKIDPFKLKHFEPIWGVKLESAIDQRSEYDRIPRTVEFLISPSSFFNQPQQQESNSSYLLQESTHTQSDVNLNMNGSSDETDIDNDDVNDSTRGVNDSINVERLLSPLSEKPLKSILKKPKLDIQENGITIDLVLETPVIEVTCITPEKIQSSPSSSSSSLKLPDISITPIVSNSNLMPPVDFQSTLESPSKRIRMKNDDASKVTTTVSPLVPSSISIQEVDTTETEDSPSKKRSSISGTLISPINDHCRRKAPLRGKSGKNSQGVDERRSLLICKEAVEKSVNNKLFYAQNGKIRSLNAPENSGVQQQIIATNITCNGSSTLGIIPEIYDGNQLPQSVPKLFNDVEITPVTNQTSEHKVQRGATPVEITVHDVRNHSEMTVKPSILSNYLAQKQQQQQQLNSCRQVPDPNHNHVQQSEQQLSLSYKLPNGITITPFSSENSLTSHVPVITHGSVTNRQAENNDLVRVPSQITIIPLGALSTVEGSRPVASPSNEQVGHQSSNAPQSSELRQTMICSEAVHTLMVEHPNTTSMLPQSDICGCDGQALTPCAACGSFCHSECIGPSNLCYNCFARVSNFSHTNSQPTISVISAPNSSVSGQTTAYFCHI